MAVDVDSGWVLEQIAVQFDQRSRHGREQIGSRLGRFDMADLLELRKLVARAHVPVEKVDVLHEADGVGGKAKTQPVAVVTTAAADRKSVVEGKSVDLG